MIKLKVLVVLSFKIYIGKLLFENDVFAKKKLEIFNILIIFRLVSRTRVHIDTAPLCEGGKILMTPVKMYVYPDPMFLLQTTQILPL